MQTNKRLFSQKNLSAGVTLVEVVVCLAIFAILSVSAYGFYTAVAKAIIFYRAQTTVSALANQYLEIARNLPYSQVGTLNGNPHGQLPDQPDPINVTFNANTYQIYYVVTALHDPADSNPTIQDYKQVKLYIKNITTNISNSFVTTIAPIDLSQMGSGGALMVQVIDQAWQPLSGATINITNSSISPGINLTRTSDVTGKWSEIGLPPDSNYHITVTKNGYSTSQTYSLTQYPTTTAPDANIIDGEVTQTTFIIDKLSNLALNTQDQTCQPISGANISVSGAKLIGPGLPKFDNDYTSNSSGIITPTTTSSCSSACNSASCCLEWDTYTPVMTDDSYMIYGTSPIQEVNILPDTTQSFTLILGPKTSGSLLAVVTDSVTGNSIEGATVTLQNSALDPVYESIKYTGGSVWSQQDWSGGSGQVTFTDKTQYFSDDGNISTNVVPFALRLEKTDESYAPSGYLISSTFDTGTSLTSYSTLTWQESFPDPSVDIGFQIATSNTNDENTVWSFIGPNGTSEETDVYSVSGSTINSANNNKRYVRYKVYLSSSDTAKTPVLSNVNINYVSGCPTPGQAMFAGLDLSDSYSATVSAPGYTPQTFNSLDVTGYFILQVSLVPSV